MSVVYKFQEGPFELIYRSSMDTGSSCLTTFELRYGDQCLRYENERHYADAVEPWSSEQIGKMLRWGAAGSDPSLLSFLRLVRQVLNDHHLSGGGMYAEERFYLLQNLPVWIGPRNESPFETFRTRFDPFCAGLPIMLVDSLYENGFRMTLSEGTVAIHSGRLEMPGVLAEPWHSGTAINFLFEDDDPRLPVLRFETFETASGECLCRSTEQVMGLVRAIRDAEWALICN